MSDIRTKFKRNKIAVALVTASAILSTSAFANDNIPLVSDDLEGVTGFGSGNSGWANGPLLSDGATPAFEVETAGAKSGWCRFINTERTQTVKAAAGSEAIPAGNDSQVTAFCNHNRNSDAAGIARILESVSPGATYHVSADAANKGAVVWGYSYFKTGEDSETIVSLANPVDSDGAWVNVSDSFTAPADIDTTKKFKVFVHTAPSATYPTDGDISVTERSLLWADNYSISVAPHEYFADGDLEGVTGFASGNSGWVNGPLLSDGATAAYEVETAGGKSGWCRFINTDRTQTVKAAAGSEAIPAGNDSTSVAFCNHNRNIDGAGIGRVVEGLTPGAEYTLSGDAATKGAVLWAISYYKEGEDTVTIVSLDNIVDSDGAWVNVTDTFTVPADADLSQKFKVFMHSAPSATYPADGDISVTERSLLWTDNYSLVGAPPLPPSADADGDGVIDDDDAFPDDPAASVDTDGDGQPDEFNAECDTDCQTATLLVIDEDDDGDGILDVNDGYPLDGAQSILIGFATTETTVPEGQDFTIDASPTIPDVANADFNWSQESGLPVTLMPDGATVTFTAPTDTTQLEDIVIALQVVDDVSTVEDTYTVTVTKAPSVATAHATMAGMVVSQDFLSNGEKIQLDGSGSTDSDDGQLSYQWSATGAAIEFDDATSMTPTFYVPLVKNDTDVTITLTVSNYVRDYDGSYVTDENGDQIVASTATFDINTSIKKAYPFLVYPLEYFPDGDLESLTGFIESGWGIGNLGYGEPSSIFLGTPDSEGNKVAAYGAFGKGWSRFIDRTRTQVEQGSDVRPPEYATYNAVAFYNHLRDLHSSGIFRQVEGIVPGGTYVISGDGVNAGNLMWSLLYTEVGSEEETRLALTEPVASAGSWVTIGTEFIVPETLDPTKPVRVLMHSFTEGEETLEIKNTDQARLWTDNYSLKQLAVGTDSDEDGIIDIDDGYPDNAAIAADTDGDGLPDDYVVTCDQACKDSASIILDEDDDNDGALDMYDAHPRDSKKSIGISFGNSPTVAYMEEMTTIDASSTVANPDNATYTWTQKSGVAVTLTSDGSMASIVAPGDLTQEEPVELELTVTSDGFTAVDTFMLTAIKRPSMPEPVINVTSMTSEDNLMNGDFVEIDARSSSESEGGEMTYTWNLTGVSGMPALQNAEGVETNFIVPKINADTVLTIELTATSYLKDYFGEYVLTYSQAEDEAGEPLFEQDMDDDGNLLFETIIDDEGNVVDVLDEEGNKVPLMVAVMEGHRIAETSVTVTKDVTIAKFEQPRPDEGDLAGSLGIIGSLLMAFGSLFRRKTR